MTKEELSNIFIAECTEKNGEGKLIFKTSVEETINWITDKISASSAPPFSNAFTGMHDRNGKPIHEGDKVKLYYKGQFVVCQVIYDSKHAAFFLKWPDGYVNQYFMNDKTYELVSEK